MPTTRVQYWQAVGAVLGSSLFVDWSRGSGGRGWASDGEDNMRVLTSFLLYAGDVIFSADLVPAPCHEAASWIAARSDKTSVSYQTDGTAVNWRELITSGLPVQCRHTLWPVKVPRSRCGSLFTRKSSIHPPMICRVPWVARKFNVPSLTFRETPSDYLLPQRLTGSQPVEGRRFVKGKLCGEDLLKC